MIYTSYFAKSKKLNDDYLVLGITRFPPTKLKENISFIAPSEELLYKYKTGKVSEEEYEEIYLKEMSKKSPTSIGGAMNCLIFF